MMDMKDLAKGVSVFFVLTAMVFYCGISFAYQFDEYKWGTLKGDVAGGLRQQGVAFAAADNTFVYDEALFDSQFRIKLLFAPKTEELCSVVVERRVKTVVNGDVLTDIVGLGDKLKGILTDKYGSPKNESDFSFENRYIWEDKGQKDTITLEYSKACWFGSGELHVTVTYLSGRLQGLLPKQVMPKDADKF